MNHFKSVHLLHIHHSFACDVLNSFPGALTKKGLKRVLGTKSRQKYPITVDWLRCMKTMLDLLITSQAALWCLLLVASLSFLRLNPILPLTASSSPAMLQFSEYAGPKRCNIAKAFCWFRCRLSQPPTFAPSQPFIVISNWCQMMSTCRFSAYLNSPYRSPSHSPFSPAFSKKRSRPLAWMPRTSLRAVSDATHAYPSGLPDPLIKLHGLIPKSKIVLTAIGTSNPLPPFPTLPSCVTLAWRLNNVGTDPWTSRNGEHNLQSLKN